MFRREGMWVKRGRDNEIVSIIRATSNFRDRYYDWKTESFKPCKPVTEIGMSDDWEKVQEEDLLKELDKEDW